MKTLPRTLILVLVLGGLFVPAQSGPQPSVVVSVLPGQAATLLPDGRWFITGGEGSTGSSREVLVWDPRSGSYTVLPGELRFPRAWHTATLLPDGRVMIFGGIGAGRAVVPGVEFFDREIQTLEFQASGPSPRADHSATLLTDGRVFIAGGVRNDGAAATVPELWDPRSATSSSLSALQVARQRHTATLQADGTVLLWGGIDSTGAPRHDGELVDLSAGTVTSLPAPPPAPSGAPKVKASLPLPGSVDVPTDVVIALRFSKALQVDTVNDGTVTLSGPRGPVPIRIVPAEGGQLAFLTPSEELDRDAPYTLSIHGAADGDGFLIEPVTVTFRTAAEPTTVPGTGPAGSGPGSVTSGAATGIDAVSQTPAFGEDEDWAPDAGGSPTWRTNRPDSLWRLLPPLQAPGGVTALAGQVLKLNGQPLAGVTLQVGAQAVQTDDTGRFLLTGVEADVYALVIDGRSANQPGRTYGRFEANVELRAGITTVLPYTVWMPKLDTQHAVTVPTYTTSDVVVTNPRIPGLELRIPAHAAIRDEEGHPVTEVTITPIPLDRPPFPLPQGVEVPLYFTLQPGGAYIYSRQGTGAALVYPNGVHGAPGTKFQFWDYGAARKGWYVYGLGTVTPDGRQVVPDPGVRIYEFTAAMVEGAGAAPPEAPPPGSPAQGGDPVDLATGLFVLAKTDLSLPDVLSIVLTRTYRPRDTISRAFGIGTSHPYDMFLVGNAFPYTWQELILADGGRIHYDRISPGTGWTDAVYEHTATPTKFYKSQLVWNGNGWTITLKDGTLLIFPESYGQTLPQKAAATELRDRFGNRLTLTRGATGNLTKIMSPNGRWIQFTYDAGNRITQATDNGGRTVSYAYDAGGRLMTVTDPNGGATQYTYDASNRMVTLRDARGIVFLTNEYNSTGNVVRQTQADSTTYQFAYTVDGGTGKITQTDVTDPRSTVRRLTFNAAGYLLTDTYGFGTSVAQTTTYIRAGSTNQVLSQIDALLRTTTYTYDSMGNVTGITRLAGTADAATTSFIYEAAFNRVTSITDALSHTSTFTYDAVGNVTAITNPVGQQTTFTYTAAGQPVTITTPAGTTTLSYEFGDLVKVTDPSGNSTTRFIDNLGRLTALTNPLGQRTRYDYDALNRLVAITDALGGLTQFGYDPNGNLLSVSDARGNPTTYTYNTMDRLATRTDPLLRSESYSYDNNGNLASLTDRKSQVTSRTYDALNRLTQATYADQSTTTYTWDAGSRLTQLVDSISGTMTRTYEGLDRLTQETTPQGMVSYAYDAVGRRTSMTVAGQPTVTYAYDNADRLIAITQGSAVVSFSYDTAGRRTALTLPNGVTTEYAYDAAGRIVGLTYKNGPTTLGTLSYSYDANSSRRQLAGTWARTGLPGAVASATYDAANRQLTFGGQTPTYDLNGNLAGDGTATYTWDARNRLVGLSSPGGTASFQYDALGRRVVKTINGTVTSLRYDAVNPVQEVTGATVANTLDGLGIDEYFTHTDASGTLSLLTDALGSTIALVDNSGVVQTQYSYEPFGTTTATGAANGNTLQFTGRENDGTGLYYYRARYYHPGRQRFVSEDPLRLASGDPNLYGYVANNPVNATDPLGLMSPKQAYAGCLTVVALLTINGSLLAELGAHVLLEGSLLGGPAVTLIGAAMEATGLAHYALAFYIYKYVCIPPPPPGKPEAPAPPNAPQPPPPGPPDGPDPPPSGPPSKSK